MASRSSHSRAPVSRQQPQPGPPELTTGVEVALDPEFPGALTAPLARVNGRHPVHVRLTLVRRLPGVPADDPAVGHVHRMSRARSHRTLAVRIRYVTWVRNPLKETAVVHGRPSSQMSVGGANCALLRNGGSVRPGTVSRVCEPSLARMRARCSLGPTSMPLCVKSVRLLPNRPAGAALTVSSTTSDPQKGRVCEVLIRETGAVAR
jgi:hypothetical protein